MRMYENHKQVVDTLLSNKRVGRIPETLVPELIRFLAFIDNVNYKIGFADEKEIIETHLLFDDFQVHPMLAAMIQPHKVTIDGLTTSPNLLKVDTNVKFGKSDLLESCKGDEHKGEALGDAGNWTKDRILCLQDMICSILKQDQSVLVPTSELRMISVFAPECPEKYIFSNKDTVWHAKSNFQHVPMVMEKCVSQLYKTHPWNLIGSDGLANTLRNILK